MEDCYTKQVEALSALAPRSLQGGTVSIKPLRPTDEVFETAKMLLLLLLALWTAIIEMYKTGPSPRGQEGVGILQNFSL